MAERLLGIDLGSKRIGLALSEPGGIVSPLEVLTALPTMESNARAILGVAREYSVDGLVIGLPLNMDGSEGPQAKLSRKLAEMIEAINVSEQTAGAGLQIYLQDERLTSDAADRLLAAGELTRKKKRARQDAIAAQILLQTFLSDRARSGE
jgi:putative holliday junction resolvase